MTVISAAAAASYIHAVAILGSTLKMNLALIIMLAAISVSVAHAGSCLMTQVPSICSKSSMHKSAVYSWHIIIFSVYIHVVKFVEAAVSLATCV